MAAKAQAAQLDDLEDDFDIGDDAEIISPKVDLRRKAKERRSKPGDFDPVAAAEAAMSEMSQTFSGWMDTETETLIAAWTACVDADFADGERKELFARAHDIKGQAATLGFPAAGQVAASLCRLLDLVAPAAKIPRELVRQHAFAVRAIAHESTQNVANPLADKLASRLTTVTDDYIASLG
jgi:HPt (histidine-containing phosphotransfer) domain-containing protein